MIKSKVLQKGDSIALISPSGGLGAIFPHRIDVARKFFEQEGFHVKEFPTTRNFYKNSSGTPEERVHDLHAAFSDSNVKAIICTIGGLSANELLSLINYEIIKKNPKIFCGYSDISILHHAIQKKTGLTTFYGPCAMTQFGENPKPLSYTLEYFKMALMAQKPIGIVKPSNEWTQELLDWSQKKDLERPRKLEKNPSWEWLHKGQASGLIVGGCLYSLLQLKGTEFNPDYKGKIMFIETPEGQDFTKGEPLPYVLSQLTDLKNAGILAEIKGLIVGRPFGYNIEDNIELKAAILQVMKSYNVPILYGADIGHTDPMITLPLGVKATLDSEKNLFSIDESGVI